MPELCPVDVLEQQVKVINSFTPALTEPRDTPVQRKPCRQSKSICCVTKNFVVEGGRKKRAWLRVGSANNMLCWKACCARCRSFFFFFWGPNNWCFYLFFIYFFICSGFCHTLKWNSHGFTCVPHPDPPSHLPLHPLPLGFPSAPGPSACLMHPTWAGDLFHPR